MSASQHRFYVVKQNVRLTITMENPALSLNNNIDLGGIANALGCSVSQALGEVDLISQVGNFISTIGLSVAGVAPNLDGLPGIIVANRDGSKIYPYIVEKVRTSLLFRPATYTPIGDDHPASGAMIALTAGDQNPSPRTHCYQATPTLIISDGTAMSGETRSYLLSETGDINRPYNSLMLATSDGSMGLDTTVSRPFGAKAVFAVKAGYNFPPGLPLIGNAMADMMSDIAIVANKATYIIEYNCVTALSTSARGNVTTQSTAEDVLNVIIATVPVSTGRLAPNITAPLARGVGNGPLSPFIEATALPDDASPSPFDSGSIFRTGGIPCGIGSDVQYQVQVDAQLLTASDTSLDQEFTDPFPIRTVKTTTGIFSPTP